MNLNYPMNQMYLSFHLYLKIHSLLMFLMNLKFHYYLKYLEPPVVLFDQMFLMNLSYR